MKPSYNECIDLLKTNGCVTRMLNSVYFYAQFQFPSKQSLNSNARQPRSLVTNPLQAMPVSVTEENRVRQRKRSADVIGGGVHDDDESLVDDGELTELAAKALRHRREELFANTITGPVTAGKLPNSLVLAYAMPSFSTVPLTLLISVSLRSQRPRAGTKLHFKTPMVVSGSSRTQREMVTSWGGGVGGSTWCSCEVPSSGVDYPLLAWHDAMAYTVVRLRVVDGLVGGHGI
jgi:hypothetical protein